MLQAALEREASQFCRLDRARAEAELADPEKAKDADELATKTLLEQILLKMKNLREELSKNSTLRDTLVSGLGEMGEAAAAQLEAVRSDLTNLELPPDEARALGSISSDLELFVEQSAKQRGKVSAPRELSRALAPLKEVAAGVERGVRNELDTVERRLAASGQEVDEAQRTGMEKRVQVLTKELHVLRDVSGRDEIAKVLHGMSQVVQGVVVRASKRMTMRDKAKDKSLAAKEQQVREMRAEAEQMREQLFQENIALKEERGALQENISQLGSDLASRDTTIAELQEVIGQRDRSIVEIQQKEQQQQQELAAAQAAEAAAARQLAVQQQQMAAAAASGAPGAAAAAAAPVVVSDGLHAAPSAQRAPAFSISNESGGGVRAPAAPRASGLTHLTTESLGGLSGDAAREVQEMVGRLGASEHRLALTDTALRVHEAQLESQPPNPARTPSPNPNVTPPLPFPLTRREMRSSWRCALRHRRQGV